MGARVRTDTRTNRLYLDLHSGSSRRKIYTHLPATNRNLKILEAKGESIEREIFLGTFDISKHFPELASKHISLTVKALSEEWLRKKETEVTALTLEWYRETIQTKILPFWGSKRLADLSPLHFDRFKAELTAGRLSPRSINIILSRLRQILSLGYARNYLKTDPRPWVVLQRDRRADIRPLNFEEKEALLKALPLRWRPYFVVALGTGLRPSEQLALTKECLDWERSKILIREGWRHGQKTALKTQAAYREVDMLPPVRKALEAQRLIAGGSELVFPGRSGGHLDLSHIRSRIWYPTLATVKLAKRPLYNTRHTFATHALASGEDPGWVAKMLGHTTLAMLVTRYYHYVPNLTRRDGTLLARRLSSVKQLATR